MRVLLPPGCPSRVVPAAMGVAVQQVCHTREARVVRPVAIEHVRFAGEIRRHDVSGPLSAAAHTPVLPLPVLVSWSSSGAFSTSTAAVVRRLAAAFAFPKPTPLLSFFSQFGSLREVLVPSLG